MTVSLNKILLPLTDIYWLGFTLSRNKYIVMLT